MGENEITKNNKCVECTNGRVPNEEKVKCIECTPKEGEIKKDGECKSCDKGNIPNKD